MHRPWRVHMLYVVGVSYFVILECLYMYYFLISIGYLNEVSTLSPTPLLFRFASIRKPYAAKNSYRQFTSIRNFLYQRKQTLTNRPFTSIIILSTSWQTGIQYKLTLFNDLWQRDLDCLYSIRSNHLRSLKICHMNYN